MILCILPVRDTIPLWKFLESEMQQTPPKTYPKAMICAKAKPQCITARHSAGRILTQHLYSLLYHRGKQDFRKTSALAPREISV